LVPAKKGSKDPGSEGFKRYLTHPAVFWFQVSVFRCQDLTLKLPETRNLSTIPSGAKRKRGRLSTIPFEAKRKRENPKPMNCDMVAPLEPLFPSVVLELASIYLLYEH